MEKKAHKTGMDLTALRAEFAHKQGKQYWRSLEQLADNEAFREMVQNEFPSSPVDWGNGLSRRRFMQLMGASMALAGLNACTLQPDEKIIPHVIAPENVVPGKPLFYATAFSLGGYAYGVLAESHEGRPTKIEGNAEHPESLGATDVFAQASILGLYDPERSQVVKNIGRFSTWESFLAMLRTELEAQRASDGAGIRILTETIISPTVGKQLEDFLAEFPLAKWHQYDPAGRDMAKAGSQMAFGEYLDAQYHLEKTDIILSLDGDFFSGMPGCLANARKFAQRRKVEGHHADMNRLYAVESSPTLTGAMADHRLSVKAAEVAHLAAALASKLGALDGNVDYAANSHWIDVVARDLKSHGGRCVVIPGEFQSPEVHYLAHALNSVLGNVGKTVSYTTSSEVRPTMQNATLRELADGMETGSVDFLLILGGNPVYNAPAELRFAEKMAKVKTRIHLSLYEDETSELCHWHIPESHYLESWSDVRALDGTASIVQPLIAPLYASKTTHEILAALLNRPGQPGHDIVKEFWQSELGSFDFENRWQIALHDGLIAGTRFRAQTPKARKMRDPKLDDLAKGLEVVFRPDPHIWDGRFANNGWLQELPKPLSKLTWDNAALVSPLTAEKNDWKNEEIIEISANGQSLQAPVWIVPGHANDSITVYLGYGRKKAGQLGSDTGFNAFALKPADGAWFVSGAAAKKVAGEWKLACTQDHGSMEGRELVRTKAIEEYEKDPEVFHRMGHEPGPEMTLYPPFEYNGYAWGMVVDLNACIGCNACTISCQSENNIAIVGKEEVLNGREMHWIRIDRYYEGNIDEPEIHHQPVMCMHCENAPCEVVCPVGATTHSNEGLNEMIYNRCVGTRYCANNCPYKVRRFNFYKYADYETESLKLMRNPDVTVRFRGVMEKCTYCVQRINLARIEAKKEDRQIQDGEVVTACQQVCPTDAIIFGDINDKNSRVAKAKAEHRDYGLLAEVGTRPRTSYLAKLKNPNPELAES